MLVVTGPSNMFTYVFADALVWLRGFGLGARTRPAPGPRQVFFRK